ncbi:hypothetical protein [Burkholderia oklahomensis]|uniref:hypothetical protein n=1 Tax=Burkholderia oklahomensis TaxID=342113 RepID=UPI0002E01FE7|nr:hypothetical protein [Burkholderia oklahomensis]
MNHSAAVTMIDRCTLPANWRVLGDAEGLSPLPQADLELHGRRASATVDRRSRVID